MRLINFFTPNPKIHDQILEIRDEIINPLASSVSKGALAETESLLKEGCKLETKDLLRAFLYKEIDYPVFELFSFYDALPKGVSISTIVYLAYLNGNRNIKLSVIIDKLDINLNGCSGLPSPIELALDYWRVDDIKYLLGKVRQSPLQKVFRKSRFYFEDVTGLFYEDTEFSELRIVPSDASDFKNKMIVLFSQQELEASCRISEYFLLNPNDDLENEIEIILKKKNKQALCFPLFNWAAKNNKSDLFNNKYYVKLFLACPDAAFSSTKIAALFDSKEYIEESIKMHSSHRNKIIKTTMTLACVTHNQDLLVSITNICTQMGLSLKNISHQSFTHWSETMLYWAIMHGNTCAIFLLEQGYDPNGEQFPLHYLLHLAVTLGKIEIVKLILEHGVYVETKNNFKQTPLHIALDEKHWNIAILLIKEYRADIYALDNENKSPMDYIRDIKIPTKLTDAIAEYEECNESSSYCILI